jgi:hypothetical protein
MPDPGVLVGVWANAGCGEKNDKKYNSVITSHIVRSILSGRLYYCHMMPMSHMYVATGVTGENDPSLIFGSVLPDIATSSKGRIPRNKIHDDPKGFYGFVKDKYPHLTGLAWGVKLHGSVLKGADYYSDDPEIGFAKIEGKKIQHLVKDLIQSEDDEKNLTLAHNFIEAGVELNLVDKYPKLKKMYRDGFLGVNLEEIARCIAGFTEIEKNIVQTELINFVRVLEVENISSMKNITQMLVIPTIAAKFGSLVDEKSAISLLRKSKKIIRDMTMKYLDEAVAGMKKNSELTR